MSQKDSHQTQNRYKTTSSRRKVLKIGGAIAFSNVVSSVAGATKQAEQNASTRADKIHNAALEIRDKTGSQAKFKEFLARKSDYMKSKQLSFTPDSMKTDGPSTQSWSDNAISTNLTLSYYYDRCTSSEPYAYFDYYITVNSDYGDGEPGSDQHTIGWNDTHYRYITNSAYSDDSMDNLTLATESRNGIDWEWDDTKACDLGLCGTKDYYVGCKAKLLETHQSRAVEASYWDVYKEAEVCKVSFDSSGTVELTFCLEGETSQYGYRLKEDKDAISGCQ